MLLKLPIMLLKLPIMLLSSALCITLKIILSKLNYAYPYSEF